jgi:hypothetical protein
MLFSVMPDLIRHPEYSENTGFPALAGNDDFLWKSVIYGQTLNSKSIMYRREGYSDFINWKSFSRKHLTGFK